MEENKKPIVLNPDFIRKLGDQIANLSDMESRSLYDYIAVKYGLIGAFEIAVKNNQQKN